MILKAEIKLIFSNAFPKKMVEILEMENDWQEPHIYTRDRKGPLFYFNFFFFEGRFPHLTVKLSLQMRQNLATGHPIPSSNPRDRHHSAVHGMLGFKLSTHSNWVVLPLIFASSV